MKKNLMLAAALALVLSAPAQAADQSEPKAATIGKVKTSYLEVHRGLLIQRKLLHTRQPGRSVVEVFLGRSAPVPSMTVRAASGTELEEGDLVTLTLATADLPDFRMLRDDALFYETGPLAALDAKHDTLRAMLFDPTPQPSIAAAY